MQKASNDESNCIKDNFHSLKKKLQIWKTGLLKSRSHGNIKLLTEQPVLPN